jgi:hypothetical protein
MSGKSTYLRTVGVNVVLALAGAPVRAERLQLSGLRIGATLRVQDSLQQGASRFFAEITRLRQVVALAEEGPGVLFLLDEILHGTNSHDRRIGVLEDELEGMRPHVGVIFGGGPTHSDRSDGDSVGSLLFAIKGGLFIDRLELSLEFAPATFVLNFNPDLPSVGLNANVGYHIPLYKSISWPLRVGIGFVTPTFDGQAGDTELALRADLIGVSVLLDDQFLLDVHVPSWRIIVDTDGGGALFTYVFGVGFSWAPEI